MPTYEYRCTACGHTLELFQRITAPAITRCPKCSGSLERLIGTGVGVIFKGSGFYATDHRSEDYKKKAKADGAPETPKPSGTPGGDAAGASKPEGSVTKN